MIVCSCTGTSDTEIRAAVDWMRAADPYAIVTPGKVWHLLGRRAECGGCMKLFLHQMRQCDTVEVPRNLRGLRCATTQGNPHEGRREGHRVSQQGAQ